MHRTQIPLVVSFLLSSLFVACSSYGSAPAAETEKVAMDKAASDCTYKTTELSEPSQTQIDCSNETSFVVRKGTDGKWREEARTVAGSRPAYATLEQAAKALCCK
jgi:hypothetical protein